MGQTGPTSQTSQTSPTRLTPPTLYVVATPLGNLEDITQRALRTLREVDLIAAEDTRHSRKLLQHFGITTPLTSYYDEVERQRAPVLVARLQAGESIALISDAGTPCVADPGYRLVVAAIEAGIRVVSIPGPSAVAAALSIAGLPTDRFVFEGFVPPKSTQRRKFFAALAAEPRTIVVYETAHRLIASLADLVEVFGDRRIVVGRELTKMYEETLRGSATEIYAQLQERETMQGIHGEITLLIAGATETAPTLSPDEITAALARLREEGMSLKDASKRLSEELRVPRRDIYQLGLRAESR